MNKDRQPLSRFVREEMKALAQMSDDDIDYSDIPETTDFSGARRGVFYKYRVIKKQVTLRLDAGILAWFKAQSDEGRGYQTRINEALRAHIHYQIEKERAKEQAHLDGAEPTP